MFRDLYKEQESMNPDTTDIERPIGEIGGRLLRKNSDTDFLKGSKGSRLFFGKSSQFSNLAAENLGATGEPVVPLSARRRLGT
jgi:hypothetical protein